jgi:putative ABC transport system permease protein
MLVPISYNLRSLFVRKAATVLTALGIGATVAVVAGVIALQQGFATLYADSGRADVAVILRPGAPSEGMSGFARDEALNLAKSLPGVALDEHGQPLASMECYLAVRRHRLDGGETNVALRGVQPETFAIRGDDLRVIEGRRFQPGTDEVIVGKRLVDRIQDCQVGEVIQLNVTPFRVVGVFEHEGPSESEIWGDLDRMLAALDRFGPNRVIAQLAPETDVDELKQFFAGHREFGAEAKLEPEYLASQTEQFSGVLIFLGAFLGLIMGIAAIFTATNTMLAALASRTHEIGVLLAMGFRPFPIFLSFLFETLLLGLLGGLVGCLLVLPIDGIRTATVNWMTFTDVAFAFRITPAVLATAVLFSLLLGLVGGALPAWRAARMRPTEALGRH